MLDAGVLQHTGPTVSSRPNGGRHAQSGNLLVELVDESRLNDFGLLRSGSRSEGRVGDIQRIGVGTIDSTHPIAVLRGRRGDIHPRMGGRGEHGDVASSTGGVRNPKGDSRVEATHGW